MSRVYRDVKGLVDKAMDEMVNYGEQNRVYEEVLRHLHSCQGLIKAFQGREKVKQTFFG